jgi:hypothetical protein
VAAVLLSASFPAGEHGREVAPYDVRQIADASVYVVRALFRAGHRLVFGAHPTISPLVLSIAAEQDVRERVEIFQSRWFEHVVPADTERLHELGFGTIRWIDAADSRDASLRAMREAMCHEIAAAVFIGGMSGIQEEAEIAVANGARCFALTAPGGATRRLVHQPAFEELAGTRYPELAATLVERLTA